MKARYLLAAIVLLAAALRLYRLDVVPPSLYWDEASLGYNAFSIATTLRDEHGVFLPVSSFAAFGDYKPPGYIYAAVPFVKILGLTELAVRLPSALAGTLLVLVTFFLAGELSFLWQSETRGRPEKLRFWTTGLLGSLLVTISPWAIQMSRAAFEANLATLFSTTGAYFFLRAVRLQAILPYTLASIFFSLALYTFNSHRVFVPILVLGLTIILFKRLLSQWRVSFIFYLLCFLLTIPLLPHLISQEGRLRFQEVTWLNNLDIIEESNRKIAEYGNTPLANLFFNRRVFYTGEFIKHYTDHFRPGFLFLSGDINGRLSTRVMGEVYYVEALLILFGAWFLLRRPAKARALVFFWLLTAPIPAALARETPHALRIFNITPMPQILVALGIISLYAIAHSRLARMVVLILVVLGYFWQFPSYLDHYYNVYPRQFAADWQYGYKELVEYVASVEGEYSSIGVTKSLGRPYIYFLFYNRYSPERYWATRKASRDRFGFWTVSGFDKYDFTGRQTREGGNLYIQSYREVPQGIHPRKTIVGPDGQLIFTITENI